MIFYSLGDSPVLKGFTERQMCNFTVKLFEKTALEGTP